MKKLLLILSLIFLTSPALADHYTLEHGKSYSDNAIASCASRIDAMGYIHLIKSESFAVGLLTTENMKIAAQNNNCVFQRQNFVFLNEDYVCEFTIVYGGSFTLLNTEVEGIKQYIIVYAPVNPIDIRPLQCIQERQPN